MKSLSTIIKAVFIAMIISTSLFAQDGEALFKAKCNSCHLVDKASTGPILKGVKQKWSDAGEAELLSEWVKNSTSLIASGKSKMANEIKGFSAMDMPAQTVTPEEVDAILTYVDNYTAPAAAPTATPDDGNVEPVVKLVPNYKENLTLFYWLLGTIVALIFGIIIIATSIFNLAKSDYFKTKLAEQTAKEKEASNNGVNTTIVAIFVTLGIMFFNNSSYALTFFQAGEAEEGMPWLKVENSDIYFLIVINIILIGVIFYLKKMFNNLLGLIKTKQIEEKVAKAKAFKKINQVLSDVVPIEEEETILMHHEYDGIRELDNNLPPWWVWMFFATVIFAVVYLLNYHVFKTGDLQYEAYKKEIKKSDAEVKAYLEENAMNVDETTATLLTDPADLDKGKAIFETNCVTCHNPKGEGNIGPNLTDKNWIYGFDIKDVFRTVKNGTPNGMPEHSSKFNPVQIQQVGSFVLSLPETKGKDPQGEIIEK